MIGCLLTCVHKQPIIALYFEFESVLKFYILEARSGQIEHLTKDFLNMEFALKYGICDFLKHNLTSEIQLLAAIWHATVLIFDIYKIS